MAEYALRAPLALALERSLECQLYAGRLLERPILDVGCGDGTFIEVLLGGAARVDLGLDTDAGELQRASRRGAYVALLTARAQRIPVRTGSVATVVSNSTLEHIVQLDEVLAEIHRVLRPDGRLFATVPTDKFDRYTGAYRALSQLHMRGAAESYRSFYDRFWRHFHYYSPDGWRMRFERAGFVVEEIHEYCSPTRCLVHDLLVPAAFIPFLIKRATGRYFLIPPLRRLLVSLFRPLLPRSAAALVRGGAGGLVFLVLRKTDPA